MMTIEQDRHGVDVPEVALVVDLDCVKLLSGQETLVKVTNSSVVPRTCWRLPTPLHVVHVIWLRRIGKEPCDRHLSHGEIPLRPWVGLPQAAHNYFASNAHGSLNGLLRWVPHEISLRNTRSAAAWAYFEM